METTVILAQVKKKSVMQMKCLRKQMPLKNKTKCNYGCYRVIVGMLNDMYTLFWE